MSAKSGWKEKPRLMASYLGGADVYKSGQMVRSRGGGGVYATLPDGSVRRVAAPKVRGKAARKAEKCRRRDARRRAAA